MPVPDFSPGEVLTAAAMDSIGLWRVGGGTFSGVGTSGQSFSAFTSDYDNYLILFSDLLGSTNTNITLQLADSVSGPVTSNYYWAGSYASYASTPTQTNFGQSNGTNIYLGDLTTSYESGANVFFQAPNLSQWTMLRWQGTLQDNNVQGNGAHKSATAYDSFYIRSSSGTISGTYVIYGYRL